MSSFNPLDLAFRAGQEMYKAGLMAVINARRQQRGRPPIGWPQVATTPADVLWTEGGARLVRYRRATPATARTPILLVCSLINRPYILDLLEERSVVRRLLERGHDVWLLDWGTATDADAGRGLDDYAMRQLPRAAAVVTEQSRSDGLHVLGYCMGGTFTLAAIAANRVPVRSLVAMAMPVAMHDDGMLSTWCRAPSFEPAALAESYGNVPPHVLQPAFKMLDPLGLAQKFVHLDGKVEDDDFLRFFLAMETWLEDSVAFPGRAFVDWVQLYRDDSLARGTLSLGGARIDLGSVRCPIFNIVADSDYITPPASSLALEKLVGSREQRTMRVQGGHIGLSTGRSAHEKLWPEVSAWLHAHDAPAQRPAVAHGAPAQKHTPRKDLPVAARKVARPRHERPADARKRKK